MRSTMIITGILTVLLSCNGKLQKSQNNDISNAALATSAMALLNGQRSYASVKVVNTTTLNIQNSTYTYISFNTVKYDHGGFFNSQSPTIVTVPATAEYTIVGGIAYAPNATGYRKANIVVNANNNPYVVGATSLNATSGGDETNTDVVVQVNLNAGDTVSLQGFQTSGGALNVDVANYSQTLMVSQNFN